MPKKIFLSERIHDKPGWTKLTIATIQSSLGNTLRLRYGDETVEQEIAKGNQITWHPKVAQ